MHIVVNIRKCRGCGKCVEVCPKDVLGQISFLIHKHVRLKNPQDCIGCLLCEKACLYQAISKNPIR